jgi:ubiquinone/menaquinone biosynthesis C-methylase UbiE
MVLETDKVGGYFQKEARRFDAIYDDRKGLLSSMIDRLFRQVVRERYRLTLERMGRMDGERVLDIGCGSGRYGISAAVQGAGEVTGIDLAGNMLDLAIQYSSDAGVSDKCKWIKGDFLAGEGLDGRFDFILAMGFFDYLPNPLPFLVKMGSVLDGTMIASFPKRWEFRNFIRKIRLTLFGCGVRYYTSGEIKELFSKAGLQDGKLEIRSLSRDYLVFYSGK